MAIAGTAAARKFLHGGRGGAAVARGVATGTLMFGRDGLWELIGGFFASIAEALAGAAHLLVLPFEALWHLLVAAVTAVASVANTISSGLGDLWRVVAGFFPHLFAVLAGAAHALALKADAFWRRLQAAAAAALPYVIGVAVVLLLVALVFFFGRAICAVTVAVCKALFVAVCYLGRGLVSVGAAVAMALKFLVPPCAWCVNFCAVVTMKAPGAAGMLISRAAFVADPALYFQILRAGGAVVAAAVFCARPVAWALAAPVAFLFRTSVSA